MPEVHLPHLDDEEHADSGVSTDAHALERPESAGMMRRSKSLVKIGLEVLLISTGVFLGLMGEQWRERARHRELAEETLRRCREEIVMNRKAIAAVKDYHVTTKKALDDFIGATPKARDEENVQLLGLQPASFERSAWDLALATQSLAYIDPQLAFGLSRIYTLQQGYSDLSRGILQALYVRSPDQDLAGYFRAIATYYGDIVLLEPKLLELYADILPRIDRALGESHPVQRAEP